MEFICTIPPEEVTGELKELYDEAGPIWQNLSLRPKAAMALHALLVALWSTRDARRFELTYFVAAARTGCSY